MMKEVIRALESDLMPLIGLIAFFLAFTLIVIRAMTMKKAERTEAKNLPLNDADEIVPLTNHTYVN